MNTKIKQSELEDMREDLKLDSHEYVKIEEDEYDEFVSKASNVHPLLNPNSPHYKMIGGREAIEYMEEMFTRAELMAWAKLTAMKYRLRIGKKDDPSKEIAKIKTFEAYYEYLEKHNA